MGPRSKGLRKSEEGISTGSIQAPPLGGIATPVRWRDAVGPIQRPPPTGRAGPPGSKSTHSRVAPGDPQGGRRARGRGVVLRQARSLLGGAGKEDLPRLLRVGRQ